VEARSRPGGAAQAGRSNEYKRVVGGGRWSPAAVLALKKTIDGSLSNDWLVRHVLVCPADLPRTCRSRAPVYTFCAGHEELKAAT